MTDSEIKEAAKWLRELFYDEVPLDSIEKYLLEAGRESDEIELNNGGVEETKRVKNKKPQRAMVEIPWGMNTLKQSFSAEVS